MQKERGWPVRDALGLHRADHAKVVRMFCHFWKEVRNPEAALSAFFELPHGRHHSLLGAGTRLCDRTEIVEIEKPTIVFDEARLVIKTIDVADAARHKQKDDAFCACWNYAGSWRHGA